MLRWTHGSRDMSWIFFSSSGNVISASGSLLLTSTWLASRLSRNTRCLPTPGTVDASARTLPTTATWSPGLARSTRSLPPILMFSHLGNCPGGRSSGRSCMRTRWKSMNADSSWTKSNGPLLLQAVSAQANGARRKGVVWSMYWMLSQRLHLNAARMTMGLTGLARTIMPSTMTSLPMCSEPNVRSCVVSGNPRKRTVACSISWAYSGSSICSCA